MKEATAEANSTVIVVVAIGVMIAFFYFTLWPLLQDNLEKNASCNKAICENKDKDKDGYVCCHSKGCTGNCSCEFECVYKG